ncbi:MauE/DoxX family redox-associated membrane protein [Xanthobacter sediminis]
MTAPLIVATAAGITLVVLARAALHKAAAWTEFRQTVADYALVPERLVPAAAGALLAAELCAIGLLLAPPLRAIGGMLAAALLALYGLAMAVNLLRGRTAIDCGCGGAGQPISWGLVARNGVLAALALLAAQPAGALGVGGLFAAAGFTLMGVLLLVIVERVDQTFHHIRAVETRPFG